MLLRLNHDGSTVQANDGVNGDGFGYSVAIAQNEPLSSEFVVIGAPYAQTVTGIIPTSQVR
jgi:hypothetical protein